MSYGTARGMANDLTWRSLLISGVHDCLPACSFTEPEGSWKIENCHLKKKKKKNKWAKDNKSIKTRSVL